MKGMTVVGKSLLAKLNGPALEEEAVGVTEGREEGVSDPGFDWTCASSK